MGVLIAVPVAADVNVLAIVDGKYSSFQLPTIIISVTTAVLLYQLALARDRVVRS
jgi:hypothetical protein